MGTDSRRKPGGKQFRLALKGLPWQEPYKSQAPYTRATATPGLPCLGCVRCSSGCSLQSHTCKDEPWPLPRQLHEAVQTQDRCLTTGPSTLCRGLSLWCGKYQKAGRLPLAL